jgi:hypothetical protein
MVFKKSTRYSCQVSVKLWFFQSIFEKLSKIKLLENPSSGSRVVPCGRTDRKMDTYEEARNAFRSSANSHKNLYFKLELELDGCDLQSYWCSIIIFGSVSKYLYPINHFIDFSIFNRGDFHQKASVVQSYVDLQLSLFCRPQMVFSKLLTNLPQF